MKHKKLIFAASILLLLFANTQLFAQKTITGTVVDSKNNTPLKDVSIRFKGDKKVFTKTDEQGKFSIVLDENGSKTVIFSLNDYDSYETQVGDKDGLTITLVSSVRYNAYGKKVSRTSLNPEIQNGILVFESKDKKFKYWFDTRVYLDGAYFFDKDALNPIGNGVNVRRARFALKANLWEDWYGEIDLDFAYSKTELKDAYIKYHKDMWNIKAGNFKEGFSMESTTTSRYITFIERSLVNEFAPSRHMGIQANVFGNNWLAIGGIHFQNIGDAEEVGFSKDANKDLGTDEGYSYTARAIYMPIQKPGFVIHAGAAVSHRLPKTDLEVPESYRISTRTLTSINRKKYLDTDDILNVENNTIYGFELAASWNQFMFQGEYMLNNINRIEGMSTIGFNGFYVQAGWLIFGGKYVYNNKEGEFTQISRGKKWGDIELAFRYDYLDLNDFGAKVYGGSGEAYTLGLNFHVNDNVKFMLNYSYTKHDRYANGKGKLVIYKDNADVTYKDPFEVSIPEGDGGEKFSFFGARIEIDF